MERLNQLQASSRIKQVTKLWMNAQVQPDCTKSKESKLRKVYYDIQKLMGPRRDILKCNIKQYSGAPTHRATKYMKQKLIKLKGETDISTMKGGALNTSFSILYRTSRQNIKEEIKGLNTINQLGRQTSIEYSTQ